MFMCASESGGWRTHVYLGAHLQLLQPALCQAVEGNDLGIRVILSWSETGKLGMFVLIPSAHIAQTRGNVTQGRISSFSTSNFKDFLHLQLRWGPFSYNKLF